MKTIRTFILIICRLDRLQAVQNAAVRLISGTREFNHVTPLLRERRWLPVKQRITFTIAIMTYKCAHGTMADYLADYIQPPSSATANLHLHSTSSGRPKTAAGDWSFAVAGPRLWNSLPTSITSAGSLAIFKKQLKTFLFRTAYDWHVLLTFSVNSVKRLRSDLSHTPLYKLSYYIHT